MKLYVKEVIIAVLVLIIISLTSIILLESNIQVKEIMDFKTVVQSVSTFGGAALGAMLAGKYAIASVEKSINENKVIQSEQLKKLIITNDKQCYSKVISNAKGLYKNREVKDQESFIRHFLIHYGDITPIAINVIPLNYFSSFKEFEDSLTHLFSIVKQINSGVRLANIAAEETYEEADSKLFEKLREATEQCERLLGELKSDLDIEFK